MPKQTLLELRHVSLAYGDRQILRDVNATVTVLTRPGCATQGHVICFLGPSGMGKTQLSRIIAGLHKPTSGVVLLDTDVVTRRGLVGMVPQNYPLFEFMTVRQNLMVAGQQSGSAASQIENRLTEFVKLFALGDYLSMYPKALSGGTQQRVAIARQMMCCEHYLVMDEPFSGLDPLMKAATSEAITSLAARDSLTTIIVVTHDISEGLSVADTVWLLGLEPGKPGARLVEQYDLAAMDLCWHPDIQSDKRFLEFVGIVKARFKTLR